MEKIYGNLRKLARARRARAMQLFRAAQSYSTKETPETPGTHVQERLKRLLVRIGENLKRLMCASVVAGTGQ